MNPFLAFLRLLREAPRLRIAILLMLMIFAGLTEGAGILLLVPFLDNLQGAGSAASRGLSKLLLGWWPDPSVNGLILSVVFLVIIRSLALHAKERLSLSIQHRLVDQLRQRCFNAVLYADWRWITSRRQAEHGNLLLNEVNRIGVGLNFAIGLLATLATALAYLVAALLLSWKISLIALTSVFCILLALSGQRRRALALGRSLGSASQAMQGNVQESLAGMKLAKILGSEGRHLEFFERTTNRLREQQLQFHNQSSRTRSLLQIGAAILLALYLYAGLNFWHTPLPELLTLVLVFGRLTPITMQAQQQFYHWLHALPAFLQTEELLAECLRMREPAASSGTSPAQQLQTGIRLKEVSISYAGRNVPALDGISLHFPARTTTAIIGPSGAGKSTLADVLMGLIPPDAGEVEIDGETLSGGERIAWRHRVAYVPQDVFLFNDSIRANLLWGHPGASEAELKEALRGAAADFVFALPAGLETAVGDGGLRLSGGERQRLALARALLKHPSLLILDEATSALDMENEAKVRRAIEQLHGGLTVVIIGHRLATLEHADQVVLINAGQVAACGSWDEVKANPAYAGETGERTSGTGTVGLRRV